MSTNEFVAFMNILRIGLIVWAIGMTIYLIKEIEAVKLLAYDPCEICMKQLEGNCFCLPKI